MSKLNYNQIETAIRTFTPFEGNSCRGVIVNDTEYWVYSYNTLILCVDFPRGGVALNARKYSQTTSRLQNLIRRALSNYTISEMN